ncbi:Oidioi.mRNA.OKI2018_I69.XSR.g13632.t1.cds [Oikopleura dioica]|uniref:Tyrosine-protein kinase n=1 Tax=Oikopleura dioica TaxID=34765 RepID=A0ABN7S951_OIKDI|nr:Oidioi.mRNA.OKI2018_I69.XSR.g13632.t1.cds [Oikopleura dioica]
MGANQGRPAKPESQGKGYHQHAPRLHATANGIINKPVPVPGNKVISAGAKVLVNGQQSGSYDVTIISSSSNDGCQRGNFLVPINSVDIMQPSRQQEDLARYPWFHAGINREEAKILLDSGVDGSFLIRNSETQAGHFSISLRAHEEREGASKDTIYHYRIQDGTPSIAVAMKTLRDENQVSDDFLKEMAVMKKLRHRNLLPLIGVVSRDKPYLLITEFMNQGSLLDFIKNANPITINHSVQLRIVLQICDAMKYLERENFIHRDLAARNCLVKADDCSDQPLVKVADFGLSRLVDPDEIYTASQGKKFPIKWTAPEGISHKRFSVKSDVWSFGVLFWEVSSYGLQPYPGIDIANVFSMLENGKRLDQPDNCPRDSYDLMKKCWLWEPDHRPSFSSLYERLLQLIDREKRSTNGAPALPDYRNHPSVREAPGHFSPNMKRAQPTRPTSTRPLMTSHNSASHIRERPHTAMGTSHEQPFIRNEPKRKSAGLLSRLKQSFGKGKSKKTRPPQSQALRNPNQAGPDVLHHPMSYQQPVHLHQPSSMNAVPKFSSQVATHNLHHHHASHLSQHEEPIPDFWLSGKQPPNHSRELAKPVPLKPPRRSRSRSKSGSGSCSSPSSQPPLALPLPQAHSSLFYDTRNFNLSELGSPQVVELTPTNSQENICENSSQSDFSSLHSSGGHVQYQKRPLKKPPVPPQEKIHSHERISDLGALHGQPGQSDARTAEQDFAKDVQTLLCLQTRLVESLSSSINKDKKSVVLSYGQRLCDFGQRLLEAEPCYLPLKTKFKFSEKLSSVKSEVSAILSNQTKDGTRLTRYSHELVNLLK